MLRQVRFVAVALLLAPTVRADAPAPAPPPDRASGNGWLVRAKVVGNRLEVRVETVGSYHLNDDYPIRLDTAGDGVRFDKARIDKKDAALEPCTRDTSHRCAAVLPAQFVAGKFGRAGGTIAFSACSADQCQIEKVAVSVPVSLAK